MPYLSDPVTQSIAVRLLKRFELIRLSPKHVCQLGECEALSGLLRTHFPTAKHSKVVEPLEEQCPESSVELVIANLLSYETETLGQYLFFAKQMLKPNGLLLFSCYGPDTLIELRRLTQQIASNESVKSFFDMHDIGDALLSVGFSDPVMDREEMQLVFSDFSRLLDYAQQHQLATGFDVESESVKLIKQTYPRDVTPSQYQTTTEIIYGHAWRIEKMTPASQIEVKIPVSQIQRKRK